MTDGSALITRKNIFLTAAVCFLLLLPPVARQCGLDYLLSLFCRIFIYGLAAASLDLVLGYGGMVSLGHAAFVGIGAYGVGIFSFAASESLPVLSWPLAVAGSENGLVTWPVAMGLAAIFALVTGAIGLRTRGMYFIMITLAFAQMVFYFFVSLEIYGGSDGLVLYNRNTLAGLDLGSDISFYYLCLAVLLIFLLLGGRLVHSRFGRVITGCRENEMRVRALGFAAYRYQLACYTMAGAAAGLSGALLANQAGFVSPDLMHWSRSGEILIMVLLGGMGTLVGPVVGAATLLLMEEILSMFTEHWMVFLGPFLLFVVLFARRGIYGLLAGGEGTDG